MKLQFSIVLLLIGLSTASFAAPENVGTEDEKAIHTAMSTFTDAWNHHDMKSFAALYAPDADFVNVIGLWWHGRAEIEKEHARLHATRMKESQLTASDVSLRFLRPDVAVAHVTWSLSGDTGIDGHSRPPRNGICTHVLTKQNGRWVIAVSQNTDIVPSPNVPEEK